MPRSHGMYMTPEYRVWAGMIYRCSKKKFKYYGGRGIKVCRRWRVGSGDKSGFECFYADLGPRPSSKHSIERIDFNLGYEDGNVRWATGEEQARNKRTSTVVVYRGKKMSLLQAVQLAAAGVSYNTAYQRLATLGYSVCDAVEKPSHARRWRKRPPGAVANNLEYAGGPS